MRTILVIIYPLCILLSCHHQEKSKYSPEDLGSKMASDWVVKELSDQRFILTKFNPSVDDDCTVYRFKKPNYFTWFHYFKKPRPGCGNTTRSIDHLSSWSFDNSNGFVTIDNIQGSVEGKERNKTRYTVFEFEPEILTFIKDKTLIEESTAK